MYERFYGDEYWKLNDMDRAYDFTLEKFMDAPEVSWQLPNTVLRMYDAFCCRD